MRVVQCTGTHRTCANVMLHMMSRHMTNARVFPVIRTRCLVRPNRHLTNPTLSGPDLVPTSFLLFFKHMSSQALSEKLPKKWSFTIDSFVRYIRKIDQKHTMTGGCGK